MENVIKKYNQPQTVLVVTSYPDKVNGIEHLNAVAWYAKKTFQTLQKKGKNKVVILAEIINHPEIYKEENLLIIRCWKKNNPFLFFSLLKYALAFNHARQMIVEYEFNIFGGIICTPIFPLFLLILRLIGKRITVELHQVILDINSLNGHLGLEKRTFLIRLFNLSLSLFYRVVCSLSTRIVVLEEELRIRLLSFTDPAKIITSAITLSKKGSVGKDVARTKLNIKNDEFVLLYFGFINWYKGADWLINEVKNLKMTVKNKNIRLILAGGESPTLKEKPHYQKFYQKLLRTVENTRNVKMTGFVKEEDIPLYFSSSDLVVLPYRALMSSSGPLSLALSYHKPFIMSHALNGYLESQDFNSALNKAGIQSKDVYFSLNRESFSQKLATLNLGALRNFSSILAKMRSNKDLQTIYLGEPEYVYSSNISDLYRLVVGKLSTWKLAFGVGQSAS